MSMPGYTKLFNSILASTIWRADDKTRIVWITLLAMADRNGVCEGSVPGLADFARVSIPDCRAALAALMAPDEDSRSKECGGRRIEEVEGGWRLINHAKYRQKMSTDERREYLKVKQREYRAKRKQPSTSVNNVSDTATQLTHTEAEATPKAKEEERTTAAAIRETPRPKFKERPRPKFKERPLPGFQRLRLFRWMVEDLIGTLGDHLQDFDLDAWFQSVDEDGSRVIPETWPWLKAELIEECRRRGLLMATARAFTPAELKHATEVRKVRMGCRHDPRCETFDACIQLIAEEVRLTQGGQPQLTARHAR